MNGRQDVARQHHIAESDLDDVLAIAQRLQDEAGQAARTVSRGDIEKVASELAIAPAYVEQAVAELRQARERALEAARKREAARRNLVRTAGIAAAVLALGVGALGFAGASGVTSAAQRAASARSSLEVVVDRQLALLPQLVAIGGGRVGSLGRYESRLRDARDIAEKLAISRELGAAMAAKLGQLPPAGDPAVSQQRLSLQHELVGMQNRITTEQRRYQEAVDAWSAAAASPTGRLGVALGWAPRAPRRVRAD